jgi:hypothetical protein
LKNKINQENDTKIKKKIAIKRIRTKSGIKIKLNKIMKDKIEK